MRRLACVQKQSHFCPSYAGRTKIGACFFNESCLSRHACENANKSPVAQYKSSEVTGGQCTSHTKQPYCMLDYKDATRSYSSCHAKKTKVTRGASRHDMQRSKVINSIKVIDDDHKDPNQKHVAQQRQRRQQPTKPLTNLHFPASSIAPISPIYHFSTMPFFDASVFRRLHVSALRRFRSSKFAIFTVFCCTRYHDTSYRVR